MDKARSQLFMKFRAPEFLTQTSDALSFHIMRSHYQTTVWRQAHVNYPDIPPPQDMGRKEEDGKILPVLMSLPPVPKASSRVLNSFHVGAPPRVSTHAVSAGNHAYHVQCNASVKLAIIYVAIIRHLRILEIIDFSHHTVFIRNSHHFYGSSVA